MKKNTSYTHPTVIIDTNVKIGKGTKIWHFCHISEGAVIGNNCTLGQNVYVGPNVIIGNNCKIQNNVSVYQGVTLEDNVFVGPSAVFTNVKEPFAYIEQKDNFASILVKKGAIIGANATIVCGVTLGEYCFVGAGALVTKDVQKDYLVVGVPARFKDYVLRPVRLKKIASDFCKGDIVWIQRISSLGFYKIFDKKRKVYFHSYTEDFFEDI